MKFTFRLISFAFRYYDFLVLFPLNCRSNVRLLRTTSHRYHFPFRDS